MFVQARAGRIFVDDAGAGDCPVLFLPSLAGSASQWAAQLAHVRRTGCAIAVDLRGSGRSDPPFDGNYTLEAAADDVMAVLEALGVQEVVLAGHSMGAAVAVVFAAAHPERVRGLVLADPVGDQRLAGEEMQTFLIALDSLHYDTIIRDYWRTIAGEDLHVREHVMRDLERTPRAAVLGMLRSLNRTDLTRAIHAYPGPKLSIVTPMNEFPFSLHRVDPSVDVQVLEGTGHWLQMEKPAEFSRLLDGFLAELPRER